MTETTFEKPVLIAHRGYSGRYPENTLLSYQAAYEYGATFMELDLQMTEDRVPFLHHDSSLLRMAGVDVDIRDIPAKALRQLNAAYPEKFADEFSDNRFTKFKKFCRWLKKHPDVTAFVEFKQESIDRFGLPVFVDEVYRRVLSTGVESQVVFISFNEKVIEYTRKISPIETGWVLPEWNQTNRELALEMKPAYLFCSVKRLPNDDQQVWQGSWQWALYNLDDIDSALAMARRGFRFLETNEIGTLMRSKDLV